MSEDKVPEWVRVKREVEALWRGAWDELSRLFDRIVTLEERVERLERDVESEGRAKFTWRGIDRH